MPPGTSLTRVGGSGSCRWGVGWSRSVGSWMRRWWWGQSSRPVSTLVAPPADQGWSWWAWQQAGWGLAVLGGAAAVADAHRDPHGLGVQAAFAADVEDLGLPAEHDRDDPGGAGEPSGLGGGDAAAGVQGAHPGGVEVGEQLLEGHGDHHGGAAAAGLGEVLGGDGLDELGERDPVADRGGQVRVDAGRGRCRPLGTGEVRARIAFSSICPGAPGIRNRPWEVPSSSSHMVNVVRCSAWASSASRALPSNFSARSGAITSNRCLPRTAQLLGVVVRRQPDQVRLRRGALLGGDGELTGARQRAPGRRRSRGPGRRSRPRCPSRLPAPGGRSSGLGQLQVASGRRGAPAGSATATQSAAVRGTGVDGGLGCFGLGEQPQPQRFELGHVLASSTSASRFCCGVIDINGTSASVVEPAVQPLGEVDHRVLRWLDRLAAHGSIQAATTDRKGPLTCGFAHHARDLRGCCLPQPEPVVRDARWRSLLNHRTASADLSDLSRQPHVARARRRRSPAVAARRTRRGSCRSRPIGTTAARAPRPGARRAWTCRAPSRVWAMASGWSCRFSHQAGSAAPQPFIAMVTRLRSSSK